MVQPYRTRAARRGRGARPRSLDLAASTRSGKIPRFGPMESNRGLPLIAPRSGADSRPGFRPAVLADRGYRALVDALPDAVPVRLALEQADGTVFRFDVRVFPTHIPSRRQTSPSPND
jgi:hypothetical protein